MMQIAPSSANSRRLGGQTSGIDGIRGDSKGGRTDSATDVGGGKGGGGGGGGGGDVVATFDDDDAAAAIAACNLIVFSVTSRMQSRETSETATQQDGNETQEESNSEIST